MFERHRERGEISVLQWAEERLANSEKIAALKHGPDREGWLDDVSYWAEIVLRLKAASRSAPPTDRLRSVLINVLASAHPNERDHPTMFAAWKDAEAALAASRSVEPSEPPDLERLRTALQFIQLNGDASSRGVAIEALRATSSRSEP